ncbi:MAG: MFS transporter [Pseudomonadota bacterium]
MNLNRWHILAVLFFARFTMAFQFQAAGALSPLIIEEHSANLADIGLLVGLYLAPGVFIAIPGGAIAVRFGDKHVVALGMVLMLVGGVLANVYDEWSLLVVSRLLAGAGGVILNVVMTKMLVDWFSGREISTAMAVFVNSWPVGIAAALLVLPFTAQVGGLALGWWTVSGLILAGLIVFLALYQPPEGVEATPGLRFAKLPLYSLLLAGVIWAFYNAALAMVFSFGPALLNEQGWSLQDAGMAISAFMVIFSIALPLGGLLADWSGRRDLIIAVSLGSFAALMPLVSLLPPWAIALVFLGVGGLFALAAGPIMTLPAAVLPPESRTFGMGVFFTLYYAVMMIAPRFAGTLADRTGDAGTAFIAGSVVSLLCIAALILFRQTRAVRAPAE